MTSPARLPRECIKMAAVVLVMTFVYVRHLLQVLCGRKPAKSVAMPFLLLSVSLFCSIKKPHPESFIVYL